MRLHGVTEAVLRAGAWSSWRRRVPFVLMLALCLTSCGEGQEPASQPPRRVLTMAVDTVQADGNAAFVGSIAARNISNQGFRVSGTVLRRLVEVGQHVKADQPLLQLDPANLELTRQQARAQLDAAKSKAAQARVDLERDAELLKQNFISQAAYDRDKVALDTANAQLHAAQAQYDQASNEVDYGTLRAAVDGVVTAIDVDVGQVVNSGKAAISIARDGDREVVISVPESRVGELRNATDLAITLWATPEKSWPARLREIDPAANKTTGTYDAHVTVLDPDPSMLLGMTAYVHMKGRLAGGLIPVPLTALVYPEQGSPAVWKVGADRTVNTHPVTLESMRGNTAYVASGLQKGDVIVTQGAGLLHEGETIEPIADSRAGQ